MLYMKSTSGSDGSYTLIVTFAVGTDPDLNNVKVQNRVSLAEPQLPARGPAQGVSVNKKSSALLQVVALTSPDGRYDQLFLSNYAHYQHHRPAQARAGHRRRRAVHAVRLQHDDVAQHRAGMTSFGLTPRDIANAISRQNIQAAVGRIGAQPALPDQQFQLNIQTKGRLTTIEEFGDIVVRANRDGVVRHRCATSRGSSSPRSSRNRVGRQDGSPPW